MLGNEETCTKLSKEVQILKNEMSNKKMEYKEKSKEDESKNYIMNDDMVNIKKIYSGLNFNNYNNKPSTLEKINTINSNCLENGQCKFEYLKNVFIKYLESLTIGDQLQIKILENVIFTVLNVSKDEKKYIEEKRLRSSFYYYIWYNAKSYISSKIYGVSYDDTSHQNLSSRIDKFESLHEGNEKKKDEDTRLS